MTRSNMGDGGSNRQARETRIFLMSAGIGALIGLISGYLYTRAAEEHDEGDGETASSLSAGQVLAVLVAVIGLVRQIAELGKPKQGDRGKKK